MKTSHSTVSNKFLSSRNDGNRLEDLSRGLDYFNNDEFDSNSIATILTVTKKSSDNVTGKNSDNKKTSSFISKSQLAQPSLEKWSSVFNKNAPNNMSINRKPNIQFSTLINGTSLASNELTILPKIGSNATTNETSHHTKHQTTSDGKVQLLPLSEQSIKRIRALLKLDQEYTAPPVPSRASPPRRRVPKRSGGGWTLQTPYYTSSSTSSSSSQTQNDLMVLKASPMRNGPPTTHKSTTPSFSSSSSSTSSSNAVSRRQVIPPQPPISSYQYPFYANNNGGRRGIEDEYLVMAVPPSTPLLQNSLEDSVIIEECCYICQHEHPNHHHYQKQPRSNSNNIKKIDKNNRVLVPKVSSSLISLNRKQFI